MLARMLLAPFLFFASMLLVEEKCCWDEPEGYQAPGWKRWLARRAKKGKARWFSRRERLARETSLEAFVFFSSFSFFST